MKKKKSIALILTFLMLLQFIPFFERTPVNAASTTVYDNNPTTVKDWNEYVTVQHLDSSLKPSIMKDGKTFYFNKELWEDLGLVVYGDYHFVNSGSKDFKAGTQNPNGTPYYTKDGVKGEYRYHGYDRQGNKITNIHFIDDINNKATLEEKKWVYHPWEASSSAYDSFTRHVGYRTSIYNDIALKNFQTSPLVAEWINKSLSFTITNSTRTGITDPVHFNNIESAPTGYKSGSGVMFNVKSSGIWYQTISVPKYKKKPTPIEADIPEIAVTKISESGDITLEVKVTGELMDEQIVGDSILESIYYHRNDVKEWNFTLYNSLTSEKLTGKGTSLEKNKKGYYIFTLTIPPTAYKQVSDASGNFTIKLTGDATVLYSTEDTGTARVSKYKDVKGTIEEKIVAPEEQLEPIIIDFDVIAPHKMLDVDKFDLRLIENDVSQAYDRYVLVDGKQLSEADETKFLNGQYTFPRIMEDRVYSYSIVYIDTNGGLWFFSSYVVVYDSVPHAQVIVGGSHKVNRKIDVTADKSITSDYLESRSTVVISEFTVTTADGVPIYYGTNTNELKEFLRKSEGNINVHVKVSNEYGSRTYDHQIYVSPDYEPDIVSMIWNNVLTRNEALDILTEGASLDGDTVTNITYQILYDTNNDGNPETVVYSGTWNGSTNYKPDKLGNYKIVFKATEEFGQATIPQHITEADKKTTTLKREFFVDNLIPMTKVYSDLEYTFPKLNVVFMTDENFPRSENDYIRESNVTITNDFRANSLVANVDLWDLYTYEFSQTAYDSKNTGTTYPPATIPYNNGGYAGTLTRTNVRNYPYTVDEGGYQTFTDSKTATDTRSGYGTTYYKYTNAWYVSGSSESSYPSSISYDNGGYKGTLSRGTTELISDTGAPTGGKAGDTYTRYKKFIAYYSGTVTRTWTEWVPNYKTYNNYYGDFSGIAYKYVKQSYTPAFQTESSKYIVYMASNSINNMSDFNYVKDIARDAKVILIADPSLQSQFSNDYFIPYSTDTNSLIKEVIKITKAENPIVNELAILINEPFTLSYTDYDEEGDPIVEAGFQYVHDPNYFDNPMGQEPSTVVSYSDAGYIPYQATEFSKAGKYIIYRRIKDEPIGFENLGGYSNLGTLELVAHRKPIAEATLDWDYDVAKGVYITKWVDNSYDPDFQYSDADKGIVDRKIKYRKNGGTWIYEIPNNLEYGNYEVEYVVMDKHGVWSTPWMMNFTLDAAPGMQILDAKLRTEDFQFTIAGVPASENLVLYDVKTRFPYETYLDIAIYQGGVKKTSSKIVNFTKGVTGTITNNDFSWSNITYNISPTLPDGSYQMRVSAIGLGGKTAYKEIPFTVKTPINLIPLFPNQIEVNNGYEIGAMTSKYTSLVQIIVFKNTHYENTIQLKSNPLIESNKHWTENFNAPTNIPDGVYQVEYLATTTNGNTQQVTVQTNVISLGIIGFVHHTEEWDKHRIAYNLAKTGTIDSPRPYSVFFPGEKLILKADTIGNLKKVTAKIVGTDYSTVLMNTGTNQWEGVLWDKSMMKWNSQDLIVQFTVDSISGQTKSYEVKISIIDDAYWRQHSTF